MLLGEYILKKKLVDDNKCLSRFIPQYDQSYLALHFQDSF